MVEKPWYIIPYYHEIIFKKISSHVLCDLSYSKLNEIFTSETLQQKLTKIMIKYFNIDPIFLSVLICIRT